jgi:hypothetical protein
MGAKRTVAGLEQSLDLRPKAVARVGADARAGDGAVNDGNVGQVLRDLDAPAIRQHFSMRCT